MAGQPLSPSDWATIVVNYERGLKNTRELGEQFGVTRQAIEKGLKERGAKKSSRLDEVRDDADAAARAELERKVKEGNKIKSEHAAALNFISKLTVKKVSDAHTAGNLPGINADLIVLGNAIKVVAKAREELWVVLNIPELEKQSDELPDLNIGEYSNDEIEGIRDAQEEAYQTAQEDDEDEA